MLYKTIKSIRQVQLQDIKKYSEEILLKFLIKKRPTIIDIGANYGQSIRKNINLFFKPKIHSFKPNPIILDLMMNCNYPNYLNEIMSIFFLKKFTHDLTTY